MDAPNTPRLPVNYVGPARDGLGVTLAQTSGQVAPATPANGHTNPTVSPADRIDPGDGSLLVRILTYLGFGRRATRSRKSFVSMLWNLFWGFSQVIKKMLISAAVLVYHVRFWTRLLSSRYFWCSSGALSKVLWIQVYLNGTRATVR